MKFLDQIAQKSPKKFGDIRMFTRLPSLEHQWSKLVHRSKRSEGCVPSPSAKHDSSDDTQIKASKCSLPCRIFINFVWMNATKTVSHEVFKISPCVTISGRRCHEKKVGLSESHSKYSVLTIASTLDRCFHGRFDSRYEIWLWAQSLNNSFRSVSSRGDF